VKEYQVNFINQKACKFYIYECAKALIFWKLIWYIFELGLTLFSRLHW
jgi:hypothetical protein